MLDKPDIRGRLAILEVHARGKPLANDASLMDLARQTVGFSGADLANLLNEAALLAARRHQDVICKPELEEAILRIMAEDQQPNRLNTQTPKTRIAFHRPGEEIVSGSHPETRPGHKSSARVRGD